MAAPVITTADAAGVALLVDWAAAEGWNPGLDDAAAFRAADPDGFLIATVDGEAVGGVSVVAYDDTYGFLGLFLVRPDWRGRGIGMRLWEAGMARLGTRAVGLDGVVAMQDAYRRSGFALAHRNVRYEGVSRGAMPADPRIARIGTGLLPSVLACDVAHFGAPREAFVSRWVAGPGRTGLALVEDGTVTGYGVIRACQEGHKIAPLFAANAHDADVLFQALAAGVRGEAISLDVPEPNEAALALAERHDLSPAFETARMYRGGAPALPLDGIFGITSFELG